MLNRWRPENMCKAGSGPFLCADKSNAVLAGRRANRCAVLSHNRARATRRSNKYTQRYDALFEKLRDMTGPLPETVEDAIE